jgi:tripartite-type tricarboxylate transporter receptor subunit TctC
MKVITRSNTTQPRRRLLLQAAALTLLAATSAGTFAQTYPSRPIRMVVGFPGGTGPDLVARVVAQKLQDILGQSVVVDNKPGAGGLIGATEVAKAAADGYTIYMGTVAEMAIAPNSYSRLAYDPVHDYAPISHVATSDFAFVVPPSLPVKNIREFVERSKGQKDAFMATFGAGTPGHFGIAMLNDATRLKVDAVHYKTTGDAMSGVISGDTHGLFGTLGLVNSNVKGGKLRAIATTGPARSPLMPDVPTAREQGYPSLEFDAWFGLVAPAKTPAEVLDKLNTAVIKATQSNDMREKLQGVGFRVTGTSRQEFSDMLRKDVARWGQVVKATGFRAD